METLGRRFQGVAKLGMKEEVRKVKHYKKGLLGGNV